MNWYYATLVQDGIRVYVELEAISQTAVKAKLREIAPNAKVEDLREVDTGEAVA